MSAWPGDERPMYNPDAYDQTSQPGQDGQAHEQARPGPQSSGTPAPPPGYSYGAAQEQPYAALPPVPPVYPPVSPGYGQPGHQMQPYQQVLPRNPAIGVIASLFVPGLGSMVNGKVGKGILILACYLVAWLTIFILIGFVLAPAVWIWGMVAGYQDAQKWNREHGILS